MFSKENMPFGILFLLFQNEGMFQVRKQKNMGVSIAGHLFKAFKNVRCNKERRKIWVSPWEKILH